MFPYLLRTDSGFIYTFTVVWLVGLILSVWLIYRQNREFAGWDALLAAGVLGLIGGRLQFVWQNGEWFSEQAAERWNLLQGGFGYSGVILGSLVGLFLLSAVMKAPLRPIWNVLAPIVPILHFAGWLACWFDGCGYGATAFISWYTAPLPDNFGLIAVRYQTQLAGMLLSLLLSLWLAYRHYFLAKRMTQPAIFWLLLAFFATVRTLIYQFQGNEVPYFGSIRSDVILSLLIVLFSMTMTISEGINSKRESKA